MLPPELLQPVASRTGAGINVRGKTAASGPGNTSCAGSGGRGAWQHLFPAAPGGAQAASKGPHLPHISAQHSMGELCRLCHRQTPHARGCCCPQHRRESCLSSLHRAGHAGAQTIWAPTPYKRKAAAGCIAKLCVGCFLATHGISSHCFSSSRLLLQSPCQGRSICRPRLLGSTGHAGEEEAAKWKSRGCQWISPCLSSTQWQAT